MGLSIKKLFKGVKKGVKTAGKVIAKVDRVAAPIIVGAVTGGNPLAVGATEAFGDVAGDLLEGKSMRKKNFSKTLKKGAVAGAVTAAGNIVRGANVMGTGTINPAAKVTDTGGGAPFVPPGPRPSMTPSVAAPKVPRPPAAPVAAAPAAPSTSHWLDFAKAGGQAAKAGLDYIGQDRAARAQERTERDRMALETAQQQADAEYRREQLGLQTRGQDFQERQYTEQQDEERRKRESAARMLALILPQYGLTMDDLIAGKRPTFGAYTSRSPFPV